MTGSPEIEDRHQQLGRNDSRLDAKTFPAKVQDIILITSQEIVALACKERQTYMYTICNLIE